MIERKTNQKFVEKIYFQRKMMGVVKYYYQMLEDLERKVKAFPYYNVFLQFKYRYDKSH